ncbi:hypothetical protein ALC62_15023 [Cyphomyrmex costatus]|uniref:THAP-type domain-containing protein n=1 Tax=Cyphomyrmex costatus TaxID=456900 RepID=A0A195C2B7_9HYME|nr:hypothetical protein ALC62_15023 [Cyphomyrmex costatus]
MSCWIRDCTTRNGKNAAGEKISRFRPFTDEMFDTWKKNGISDKGTKEFTKDSYICELHFKNEDVIKEDVFHVIGGPIVTIPRNRKHLRKNAVPCIFPPPVSKKTEEKLSYYHVLKPTVYIFHLIILTRKLPLKTPSSHLEYMTINQNRKTQTHHTKYKNAKGHNQIIQTNPIWKVIPGSLFRRN